MQRLIESIPSEPTTALVGVGLPGIGKTKFLSVLAEKLGFSFASVGGVYSRIIPEQLGGNAEAIKQEKQRAWAMAVGRACSSLAEGRSVVFDAANARPRDRRKIVHALNRVVGVEAILAIYFVPDLEISLQVNAQRHSPIPEGVIFGMYNNLTRNPPSVEEGFQSVITVGKPTTQQ